MSKRPSYGGYPQLPYIIATDFETPDKVPLIHAAETIIIEARNPHDKALRETCREYLGWYVDTSKPMPAGEVAWCLPCHEYKHVRDFYPDATKKNGLMSRCKECEKKRKKRASLTNLPRT